MLELLSQKMAASMYGANYTQETIKIGSQFIKRSVNLIKRTASLKPLRYAVKTAGFLLL